ncbi:hypothetical protein [Urbifossiella limnaea]|uniref:Glycine zipper domain-containing protein n=1 Tax=Urbifossiella limnaea TaxID=2528023 RepID=A0A517XZM7_9BACT|nr:hypothetical protein [Urbifossiella limnaea]QDU22959.1 hypothetical protein ETAA1_49490 [Urbifossiella limnaea]
MAASTTTDPEKTVDLPPYGPRNPDPITNTPGSHPIETGVGAVLGGVATGLAVGTLTAGPLGAVAGAIVGGAAAGGLAGKGIGELIDPTTEDNWIREYFGRTGTKPSEDQLAAQRRAYRYGQAAQARHPGMMFSQVETSLRDGWEASGETSAWADVRDAVRGGFDRTL